MKICQNQNGTTEVSLFFKERGGNVTFEILRDNPCFNHAYREAINLSVQDMFRLKGAVDEFLYKKGYTSM